MAYDDVEDLPLEDGIPIRIKGDNLKRLFTDYKEGRTWDGAVGALFKELDKKQERIEELEEQVD